MPPYVRRGVTQLMYVGDDDAAETAVASGKNVPIAIVAAVVALGARGGLRVIAAGVAAVFGYRAYKGA